MISLGNKLYSGSFADDLGFGKSLVGNHALIFTGINSPNFFSRYVCADDGNSSWIFLHEEPFEGGVIPVVGNKGRILTARLMVFPNQGRGWEMSYCLEAVPRQKRGWEGSPLLIPRRKRADGPSFLQGASYFMSTRILCFTIGPMLLTLHHVIFHNSLLGAGKGT